MRHYYAGNISKRPFLSQADFTNGTISISGTTYNYEQNLNVIRNTTAMGTG